MQPRRALRLATLVLLMAASALSVGGRISVASTVRPGAASGGTETVSAPLRALEVVLRADDESNDGLSARPLDPAGSLTFVTFAALGLILAAVGPGRRITLAGDRVRSRSPRRHAVALRAPPAIRLL